MDKKLSFGSLFQRLLVIVGFVPCEHTIKENIKTRGYVSKEAAHLREWREQRESFPFFVLVFVFKTSPPKLVKLCFCTSLIQPRGQSHHIPFNSRKTSLWTFLVWAPRLLHCSIYNSFWLFAFAFLFCKILPIFFWEPHCSLFIGIWPLLMRHKSWG